MVNTREQLNRKLDNLSPEQIDSVYQFVDSIEHRQPFFNPNYPLTNEDIDKIVESYRQQNKQRPIGLAKGELTIGDDFNDPLPDEILDLFNNPQ